MSNENLKKQLKEEKEKINNLIEERELKKEIKKAKNKKLLLKLGIKPKPKKEDE